CSTVYGDDVCRGCKRFANEVIEWNTYSSSQKSCILSRLDQLSSHVAGKYIAIIDATLLEQQCQKLNVRYRKEFNPLSWAHLLLKTKANRMNFPEQYGIEIQPDFRHLTSNNGLNLSLCKF
ncbi:MAG: hypothetical protein K0S29_648, partial [Gammaproteobacteria bacterium]|nr:hypothetical protein [Gammaproteobacteria bacterium]